MVKVGVIGCGDISRFHIEGYARAGACITHVCDMQAERAQEVANRFGAKSSTDHRALLADPEVELVSITVMTRFHKELALAAIAAGKGVVCEKTLGSNADEALEIAQAADKAGVFFGTAYMKRFFPAIQQAKALLADMGEIISVYARSWQPWDGLWDRPLSPDLLAHPSSIVQKSSGGVLLCGGSHIIDLIQWLGGRPTRVCGQMKCRENADFDIQANAMLWLPNDAIVHFEACWHPLRFAGYERNGWDERLEINTVKGRLDLMTVLWNCPENNGALLIHQDAETGRTTEYRYPAMNPFYAEMAEMARRFEAGEPGFPSVWDGYAVDEVLATIAASAQQQATLPIVYRDQVTTGGAR